MTLGKHKVNNGLSAHGNILQAVGWALIAVANGYVYKDVPISLMGNVYLAIFVQVFGFILELLGWSYIVMILFSKEGEK